MGLYIYYSIINIEINVTKAMKIRFSILFTVHYLLHIAREDCRRKWQKKAIDVNTVDNLKYIDMKRQ